MSHSQGQRIEWRAIFAVAAVCALVFGLLVSGAQNGARAEASMRAAAHGDAHHAMCHYSWFDAARGGTPDDGESKRGNCPCCLAGHIGAAALPERFVTPTRLEPTDARALFVRAAGLSPRFAVSQTVNGARAPPRFLAIS